MRMVASVCGVPSSIYLSISLKNREGFLPFDSLKEVRFMEIARKGR